jgi:hypothetical protein
VANGNGATFDFQTPGISNHPSIGMGRSMSLKTVAGFSGGMITDAHLAKIAEDFAKLA